jgi:hypothetical protein
VVFYGTAFTQDNPKPEQIDQFGRPNCEDLAVRSQNFANQISMDPSSKGLVIVNASIARRAIVQGQFRAIIATFAYFNAEDRVEFVLNPESNDEVWELWKIPVGAAEPAYEGEKWILPVPDLKKAFIYGYEDEDGICPPTFVIRKFAELLTNNPSSRANIVVKNGTMYRYSARGFADRWVGELTRKFSVSKNRIRVFYVRGDSPLTYVEFWFVPARKQ